MYMCNFMYIRKQHDASACVYKSLKYYHHRGEFVCARRERALECYYKCAIDLNAESIRLNVPMYVCIYKTNIYINCERAREKQEILFFMVFLAPNKNKLYSTCVYMIGEYDILFSRTNCELD